MGITEFLGSTRSKLLSEEFELPTDKRHGVLEDASHHDSTLQSDGPPLRHIDKYIRPECPCLTKRVTVALLTCIGFIVMFGMRCNMTLARLYIERQINRPLTMVDSAIFWGYLISQVPGGFLATKYPANKLFGGAIGMSSFLNLLVPTALGLGPSAITLVLVLQGLLEGVTFPAFYGILRYWAPPLERSRLATLAFCGSYVGILLGMPISGELMRFEREAPFYLYGCLGIVWYLTWLWLAFERPNKHTTIDAEELRYIGNSLEDALSNNTRTTIGSTPWKVFLTSLPVWAIIISSFCWSWNYYLLVIFQASYMSDVYNIDIEENAILGALPHLLLAIIVPSGGVLADYLRKQGILSTTQVRKLFNCGAFGMQATLFLIVAFSKSYLQAITALTFGVAFNGFAISGYNVNQLDIAPKYASILMGMSNVIGIIAGCMCPIAVREFTDREQDVESWKRVFLLAATIQYLGAIFYGIFASGELQPWAGPYKTEKENQRNPLDKIVQKKKGPTIIILIVFSEVCLLSLSLTIYIYKPWF